jgi:hypothetical protein
LSGAVDGFLSAHEHLFSPRESDERPLECHDTFLEYRSLIEGLLEDFQQERELSIDEVTEFCQLLANSCEPPTPLLCVDYILAAIEYEDFDDMMVQHRELREWQCDDMEKYGRPVPAE